MLLLIVLVVVVIVRHCDIFCHRAVRCESCGERLFDGLIATVDQRERALCAKQPFEDTSQASSLVVASMMEVHLRDKEQAA